MSPEEVLGKVNDLLAGVTIANLTTMNSDDYPVTKAMAVLPESTASDIWFDTNRKTTKIQRLTENSHAAVQFYFDDHEQVCLSGDAEVIDDKKILAEHWRDEYAKFHPGGVTDPGYVLIRLRPRFVSYRDTDKKQFDLEIN